MFQYGNSSKAYITFLGNAKPSSILAQMIAEAHEIRENQSYRNIVQTNSAGVVAKQNINEESVSF